MPCRRPHRTGDICSWRCIHSRIRLRPSGWTPDTLSISATIRSNSRTSKPLLRCCGARRCRMSAKFMRSPHPLARITMCCGHFMRVLPAILLSLAILPAQAEEPTVDQIMARVAENQARAQDMRRAYVYNQKVLARFHRTNGKLAREEKLEYLVTPSPAGVEKKLTHFEGKCERGGKFITYDEPGKEIKDLDIDGDLIRDMVKDMTADKDTKDGLAHDM